MEDRMNKTIVILALLSCSAFAQSKKSTPSVPHGEAKTYISVSCQVVPSAQITVPLVTFNTAAMQSSIRRPQASSLPQIYWVPMMPYTSHLANIVFVNGKPAIQGDAMTPYRLTTTSDEQFIYFDVEF
jgi:hypothetical protein